MLQGMVPKELIFGAGWIHLIFSLLQQSHQLHVNMVINLKNLGEIENSPTV